jgi:cyclase
MLSRVIPILLIENGELIKTTKFKNPTYIGDLLNSVKIYNELEVDELYILDRGARKIGINYYLISQFVDECYAPISYGGGVKTLHEIEKILKLGVEKIVIRSKLTDSKFMKEAIEKFGSSTIVACLDYVNIDGNFVTYCENNNPNILLNEILSKVIDCKVGDIIFQSVDRDGTYSGYDIENIKNLTSQIQNPIIIAGGCKNIEDIKNAFNNGFSGAAAGSLFVYYSDLRGVLINYPSELEFYDAGIKR